MSAFQSQRRAMMEPTCDLCGSDDIIEDRQQGHRVCNNCGTILEEGMVYEGSEWRTFNEKDKPGDDPNRVGAAENPLLSGAGLGGGMMKNGMDDGGQAFALNRRQHRSGTDPTARLQKAFSDISSMCDRIGLAGEFKNRAQELYVLFVETHGSKSTTHKALCCACIFESCKLLNAPRRLKELDHALSGGVSIKRAIQRAHKMLKRVQQQKGLEEDARRGIDVTNTAAVHEAAMRAGAVDVGPSTTHPSTILPRIADELGFTKRGIMVAKRISQLVKPEADNSDAEHQEWHGQTPATLAAVTLYVSMFLGDRVLMKGMPPRDISDLVQVTRVAETTILNTYAKLYPHLKSLIPADLRPPLTEEEWLKFPQPKLPTATGKVKAVPSPAAAQPVGIDLKVN